MGDKWQRKVECRTRIHRQPGTVVYNCSGVISVVEGISARGRGENKAKDICKIGFRSCGGVSPIEHDHAIRTCYARHSWYFD